MPKPIKSLAILCLVTSSLGGCVTAKPDRVVYTCPPRPTYSAEAQNKLADEIVAMPEDAEAPKWVGDWVKHREACNALEAMP